MMSKVPFNILFPSKKLLNRILFQMDSELPSRKLIPLYERLYEDNELLPTFSQYASNSNIIFLMNRVLVELKKRTKRQSISLHKMELYLLKRAAQLGNNDAIALLCYQILSSPKQIQNDDEVKGSQILLKQLVEENQPLSFKILADLNCLMGDFKEGKTWYSQYLKATHNSLRVKSKNGLNPKSDISNWGLTLRGEVLEKLAEIEFREGGNENIIKCEERFLEVIQLLPLKDCVKSYFFLSQLYIKSDPERAKVLLELCCTQGFKETFKEIGYLEMNYFQNPLKAREWFKIGMELMDLPCFFGYFETCLALKDWVNADNCVNTLTRIAAKEKTNQIDKEIIGKYLKFQEKSIANLRTRNNLTFKNGFEIEPTTSKTSSIRSKWDL